MKRLRRCVPLLVACAIAVPASADEYDDAVARIDRGDVAGGLPALRALSEQGHARAPNAIGILYQRGRGVPQDDAEAARWYRIAADRGFRWGQDNLGVMYRDGRGVPEDPEEAVRWFRLAADQGLADAQNNLGVMYRRGRGVGKDEAEAVRWYRKAADQGLALAQANLGFMYRDGSGVARDDAEAFRWFRAAAERGNVHAQVELGVVYRDGRGVPRDDAEAMRWFRKAVEWGSAPAQRNLAEMYATGRGGPLDESEAVRWYWNAASQGDVVAQTRLGTMLRDGRGVPRDPSAAQDWFAKAAASGHPGAQAALDTLREEAARAANARAISDLVKAAEADVPELPRVDAERAALAREIVEAALVRQRVERMVGIVQSLPAGRVGPSADQFAMAAYTEGLKAAFAPAAIVQRFEANLAAELDAQTLRVGLEWERSPTGRGLAALRLASNAPDRADARRDLRRQFASAASDGDGDRVRACAEVDALSDLTDSTKDVVDGIVTGGARSASESMGPGEGLALRFAAAMLQMLTRELVRRDVLVDCLVDNREASDAELETWLAFLRTPAGGRYARGMSAAAKDAVLDRSAVVWQVVSEAPRKQRRERPPS